MQKKKQIKTESGKKVKADKTGIYKRWKERSHSNVNVKGASTDGEAEGAIGSRGKNLL